MENERIPDEHEMLADKIRAILYYESSKDVSEIDDDLVAECADYLMELEKRECLSKKEIRKEINKIFAKSNYNNKRNISLKHLLIAAILMAVMMVSYLFVPASSNDEHINYLISITDKLLNLKDGESLFIGNKEYYFEPSYYSKKYETFEKFYKKEKLDVLYPSALPGNLSVDYTLVTKDENGDTKINYITHSIYGIKIESGDDFSLYINKETAEFEVINGLECYYHVETSEDAHFAQCAFARNGFIYVISTYSYDDMVYLINNLKEF